MMHRLRINYVVAIVFCCVGATQSFAVNVWLTTGDKSQLLRQQTDVLFQPGLGSGGTAITVNSATTYQTIEGVGASMTDSSAWVLQNELTTPQRDKLMRQLFSSQSGIGVNYLRVPMGASDFTASGYYTYNDNPVGGTDEFQQQFSIAHDQAYIIPRLQQARLLNPDLKLMASPWSAPAWMKTNHSLAGGSLATQWEGAFARYLTKFVQAYEAQGLPINTLTLQNEPLHTSNYPTMSMPATQQVSLIKNQVGPMFAANGINTKLLAYDHNWDDTSYPLTVLNDAAARQYVAGTAFHAYAGDVSAQTTVHNAYPDKDIYFTEISGGDWATNFADNIVWNFQNILIGNMRNWGKSAIFWNLALDQNHNPHLNGCSDCRGVVTVNNSTGAVTFNEEFYSLGQVTRVVQPGAIRISSPSTSSVNTVAFLNPDGSRALVALNPNATATTARIIEAGKNFSFSIPGKSVASFLWEDAGADFNNGAFDDGGFQLGGGSLDAWTTFGNTIGNVSVAAEAVLSGDKSLKLYGQFSGTANSAGVWQGITVKSGDVVRADLSALIRAADSITGTANYADMKIEFYNQYGSAMGSPGLLSNEQLRIADSTTANDMWNSRELVGIAPLGAVEARLVLQFVQPNNEQGAVHIDDVSFDITAHANERGDYDANGVVDQADYLVWRNSLGSNSQLGADGNGNGIVDAADYVTWRKNLGTSPNAFSAMVPEPAGLPAIAGFMFSILRVMLRFDRGVD